MEKEKGEFKRLVPSYKNRVEELLVDEKLSRADFVAAGLERDSLRELLAAKNADLEGLRVTVGARSDYVKLSRGRVMQQQPSLQKTEAALEMRLAQARVRLDTAFTEATSKRGRLHDEVDHLSSDQSAVSVELRITVHQLSAMKTEIGAMSGQLTEQKT